MVGWRLVVIGEEWHLQENRAIVQCPARAEGYPTKVQRPMSSFTVLSYV